MEEFEAIWERVKHENELINQRLTWLGTFQGLLLAALAFAWDKSDAKPIIFVLGILGIAVAASIAIGTCRANQALNRLGRYWDKVKPKDYSGLDVEGIRSQAGCFWWLMPGYFLPIAFLVAWVAILYFHYHRPNITRQPTVTAAAESLPNNSLQATPLRGAPQLKR